MYRLTTTWHLPAAPEPVWGAVEQVAAWPHWWPGIDAAAMVRHAGSDGLGQRVHLVVRSPFGYRLRFGVEIVAAAPPRYARARVVGDLVGLGSWRVDPAADGCIATIRWEVTPARGLLHALGPLVGAPARWAHARVMHEGQRGLVTHLTRFGG
ncbi:SRPBCC family protein [Pseudactinotalea terrae]|uniref:SRPBCC family protein n=1 Tax=Pseudactinotalea terrae TaxID=1743262 RepID=UPI0013909E3B|nr:SRPBCC family protein [Pseudactinotalea terrae]